MFAAKPAAAYNEKVRPTVNFLVSVKKTSLYTPYSKITAILVFFCFHANWPFWPRSRLNILLNFTFESEAIRANLHGNKGILKWRPFWNKVYGYKGKHTRLTVIDGKEKCSSHLLIWTI